MKKLAVFLILSTFFGSVYAQTPDPPPGKVWILNTEMSDEFDANSPGDKWSIYDKAQSWDRTAAFDKRVQEVQLHEENGEENYILAMNPMWYEEEDIFTKNGRTYYFAGGGMASEASTTYGYMEVRIKASNFPMGSGVFMHSRKSSDNPCGEKYGTELDIIENMSYNGPGYSDYWNGKMHVNTHVKPTDDQCNGLPSIQHGGDNKPLEGPLDFNVVGAHWKNKDSVDFYLNGNYWHSIEFLRDFNLEMPVILTMETYTWGSDENNADNPKPEEYMFQDDFRTREERAVYYDWVRTWQLADIDTSEFNDRIDNVGFYQDPVLMFEDSVLEFTLLYSATESREIIVSVYDADAQILGRDTFVTETGVKSLLARFETGIKLPEGENYMAICSIRPPGGGEATILAVDTAQLIILVKAVETKLLMDEFPTWVYPSSDGYSVGVQYQGADNMEIAVEVRDPSGAWIGGGVMEVPDGEGNAQIWAALIQPTEVGSGYFWKSHIRPRGTTWQESVYGLDFVPFQVVEEPQNEISLSSLDWPYLDTATYVDVTVYYKAMEEASLMVQLFMADLPFIADTSLELQAGEDTLYLQLSLKSKPIPGDDYQIIGSLYQIGNDVLLQGDTLKNLEFVEYEDPLGFNEYDRKKTGLRLYPNPASESVFVEIPESSFRLEFLTISDVSGRIFLQSDLGNVPILGKRVEMDISSLPPGFYFLSVFTDNVEYTTSFKID